MKIQDIFTNKDFQEAITWAIIKFCQEHKRDIPLPKMINGSGDGDGNANKYKDAYGVEQDTRYADAEAYNRAVNEWNMVDKSVNEILNAQTRSVAAPYIDAIQRFGAAVFVDLAGLYGWESWESVPELSKQPLALQLVRRQLYAKGQQAVLQEIPQS